MIKLQDTVEITRSTGEVQRGIVTGRDWDVTMAGIESYQVWVPGANVSVIIPADRVTALPDTRPMRLSYES